MFQWHGYSVIAPVWLGKGEPQHLLAPEVHDLMSTRFNVISLPVTIQLSFDRPSTNLSLVS